MMSTTAITSSIRSRVTSCWASPYGAPPQRAAQTHVLPAQARDAGSLQHPRASQNHPHGPVRAAPQTIRPRQDLHQVHRLSQQVNSFSRQVNLLQLKERGKVHVRRYENENRPATTTARGYHNQRLLLRSKGILQTSWYQRHDSGAPTLDTEQLLYDGLSIPGVRDQY